MLLKIVALLFLVYAVNTKDMDVSFESNESDTINSLENYADKQQLNSKLANFYAENLVKREYPSFNFNENKEVENMLKRRKIFRYYLNNNSFFKRIFIG